MKWTREVASATERKWEEFYRNRFQHDKRVRTTHGVNCTGSCSWEVFVKDGIVTWELQATDYPRLEQGLPPYEPRGCQRGISFSWYLYSPIRVKHPYARGALIDAWRAARAQQLDPVDAWASLMADPATRGAIQQARGKGGFRRVAWDEALDIIAASTLYTAKTYGPDRVIGFSPIPAMSQVSYAAGSRFLSLFGGVPLSFYDWYSDLPPASPEVWGEQTDVHESADWYNARFIAVMGSNLNMTRTPDTHFASEVRHAGAHLAVLSPDFSQVAKYADWWIPTHAGQDGAFWMAVNHVILREFYVERRVPFFTEYLTRFTDAPFLVRIEDGRPQRFLRAGRLAAYRQVANPEWKLLVWDGRSARPRMPQGTIGFRWAEGDQGKWNLEPRDGLDGEELEPELSFVARHDAILEVTFDDLAGERALRRALPIRYVDTDDGRVAVATAFDLLLAQFGVASGGAEPVDYDDADALYTPAWQEACTGVHRDTLLRFARKWASNAEKTEGKNLIIVGAGTNHWYHNNLIYRSAITALMLTGAVGRNGGGLAHYVGQEKLACHASWAAIAFGADWGAASRQQNAPSFHYVHTDQWRYEPGFGGYDRLAGNASGDGAPEHTIDQQAKAVRMGWLPFFPQFDRSPLRLAREAAEAGATTDAEIVQHVVDRLRDGTMKFAVDDPDAPENWPRVWLIWRGNAIGTSMKGHEFMLRHYLGTHSNASAPERAGGAVHEVVYREAPLSGKLDLVVDINFRMDTSALYSDIVLPAATWYEKDDLNTTDLHSFINPMQAAVQPAWESRSDWEVFKGLARKVSELARTHLPEPVADVVMQPLKHDTADELAQPHVADWRKGEVEAVPGRTMPKFQVVRRDYVHLYDRMLSLGPAVAAKGLGVHGLHYEVADFYAELLARAPRTFGDPGGVRGAQRPAAADDAPERLSYPSLESARDVANAILLLDPVSNGELAYRAFEHEEARTGRRLTDLAAGSRDVRIGFDDLVAQPRRVLTSPTWTGILNEGRAYTPFALNRERLVPWRTLTGRQHFYLDHEQYLRFGEALPTYKPKPDAVMMGDVDGDGAPEDGMLLNYITPHGKWSIHSTYSDNHRMMTLSRGDYPVWLNYRDARTLGIRDNDWVELINNNGVFVQRCITSSRIPRGAVFVYHATERTIGIPKSPTRGRRAGMNNSITRARLKPVLMSGGYAQFSYGFNYWGPTGANRDTFVYVHRIDKPEF